jgi:hypothetical protein
MYDKAVILTCTVDGEGGRRPTVVEGILRRLNATERMLLGGRSSVSEPGAIIETAEGQRRLFRSEHFFRTRGRLAIKLADQ